MGLNERIVHGKEETVFIEWYQKILSNQNFLHHWLCDFFNL